MNLSLLTRVRIFLVSANPLSRLSICTVVCRIHNGTVKICINQKQISSGFYLKKSVKFCKLYARRLRYFKSATRFNRDTHFSDGKTRICFLTTSSVGFPCELSIPFFKRNIVKNYEDSSSANTFLEILLMFGWKYIGLLKHLYLFVA